MPKDTAARQLRDAEEELARVESGARPLSQAERAAKSAVRKRRVAEMLAAIFGSALDDAIRAVARECHAEAEKLRDFMREEYDLDYELGELDDIFNTAGPDMAFSEFQTTIMKGDPKFDELKAPTLERGLGS